MAFELLVCLAHSRLLFFRSSSLLPDGLCQLWLKYIGMSGGIWTLETACGLAKTVCAPQMECPWMAALTMDSGVRCFLLM